MRNISNKMEIIENIFSQESKDLFTTYHELSNQQAYFYTRSKEIRRGFRKQCSEAMYVLQSSPFALVVPAAILSAERMPTVSCWALPKK